MKSIKKEKRLSKKEQIQERRYQFWLLMSHGAKISEAVKVISERYDVGKAVLYSDWSKREEWGVVEAPEKNRTVQDVLFSLDETKRAYWNIVNASPKNLDDDGRLVDSYGNPLWPFELPDVKLRSQILARIVELNLQKLQVAQSVGIVPQKGLTISNISANAESFRKWAIEYCGKDEELLRALVIGFDNMMSGTGDGEV
jgi:hypothetical protein